MKRTNLYRHIAKDGTLLYVGITKNFATRHAEHSGSEWFNEIAQITVEDFPTRELAAQAEEKAIREERPVHNRAVRGGKKYSYEDPDLINKEKKDKINFHLEEDQLDALRALRKQTGASMSELIRRAISAYIERKP